MLDSCFSLVPVSSCCCFPGTLLMGPETPEQQLSLSSLLMYPRCCVLEGAQGCLSFRKVRL